MKYFFYLLVVSNLMACKDTSEASTSETTEVGQVIPPKNWR